MADYTEAIQIEWDVKQGGSFEQLLTDFWDSHNPTYPSNTQYQSAIFYHSEAQRKAAVLSKKNHEKVTGQKMHTLIAPFKTFYVAEGYHQKFYVRKNAKLMGLLNVSTSEELTESPLACKLNAWASGFGPENLDDALTKIEGGVTTQQAQGIKQELQGKRSKGMMCGL